MLTGNFHYSESRAIIAGFEDANGVIYLTEGQHRMNAALEILKEGGDLNLFNDFSMQSDKDSALYISVAERLEELDQRVRQDVEVDWEFPESVRQAVLRHRETHKQHRRQ